ncbi:MAG TPA: Hsp70 family protein [Anaeromyxobacteraceae bacterium]|nr:Hsp70 family protein [Anaeromyxobacteraceae bacterium]
MPAFGIDLGTTNSSISWLSDGKPVPIPIDGHPIVPSVVLYDADRVVVGREARNLELQRPNATIRSVKRRMGQEHRYTLGERLVTPEEVSAEILGALKRGAEQATGQVVQDVVITVPAYFDDAQRRSTLKAGELAGMNVLRLLNEPTSASLVYDQIAGNNAAPEIVMIYDLGGGTFDVSILEVVEGIREVRATAGNTHLGGDDFDDALLQLFLEELRKSSASPKDDPRAMARMRRLAEDTKIRLSSDTQIRVREEFLCRDRSGHAVQLDCKVTRRELERRIGPLIDSTIALCRRAMDDAHLSEQSIGRICLVGGSTRIPLVRALLAETFGADIHEEIDPDLAVALGASVQAGMLTGASVDRILVDVASHSLGVRVVSEGDLEREEPDTFAPVLRRNTVLPATRTDEYYTMVDEQKLVDVEVFQGEAPRCSQNARVGSFKFDLQPAPLHSAVRIEFAYDLNGVVRVSVSQPGTSNVKTVALSVADAGRSAQGPAEESPVERKARSLLSELEEDGRAELEQLLQKYTAATGDDRQTAEEALLDFFLDLETDDDEL